MAEDEEVAMELEAVQAVYGEDCVVLDSYPAHLHLHIKPRTADVSSRQFVEAVISIRAGSKESVEKLSAMNHPGGDCPLCLNPLFPTEEHKVLPFMKLMSCFHCFYSECIIRWWNWLQDEKETFVSSATAHPNRDIGIQKDMHGVVDGNTGNCPVCRKVFHAKDIEHMLNLVGSQSSLLSSDGCEIDDKDDKLLHSDLENIRRQKFEAILKLQQENSALIDPKRDLVVLPGMFLPQPATFPTPTSPREMAEQEQREPPLCSERNPSSSSIRPSSSRRWDSGWRKQRVRNNLRKQNKSDSGSEKIIILEID